MILKISIKKKYSVCLFYLFAFFINSANVLATSPSKIEFSYDPKERIINVFVQHVSGNVSKHHIRKIEVYKNQDSPLIFYFPSQKAKGIEIKIPLEIQESDKIRIKAVCKQAGFKEEIFNIDASMLKLDAKEGK